MGTIGVKDLMGDQQRQRVNVELRRRSTIGPNSDNSIEVDRPLTWPNGPA